MTRSFPRRTLIELSLVATVGSFLIEFAKSIGEWVVFIAYWLQYLSGDDRNFAIMICREVIVIAAAGLALTTLIRWWRGGN